MVSTDPPYYDNIGYADLSDFFYVWLRRTVGGVFPDVCSTLLAPKAQELIAASYRHGGDRDAAEEFFEGDLQKAHIAPVDVAQAAIGPGMAVFSRYSRVIEADGAQVGVRAALSAVNRVLDETLEETGAELDSDTRWALTWHAQHGFESGDYGSAEQLSKSRNTSVEGLVSAGIVESRAGRVRLIPRHEFDEDWSPAQDERLTVWEITNHLARKLETRGEQAAARLLAQVGGLADAARLLAYRLHHICDRNGWAADALAYNSLAAAWPDLTQQAHQPPTEDQANLALIA